MKLGKLLAMILLVSLLGLSLAAVVGDFSTNYNLTDVNISYLNVSGDLVQELNQTSVTLQTTQWYERVPIFGVVFSMGKILWTGARVVWISLGGFYSLVSSLFEMIGLPGEILSIVVGLIILAIIVAFLRTIGGNP